MSVCVKICGITNGEDARAVGALQPDALGVVFWPRSSRYVAPAEVGGWDLPGAILKVGVFVDSPPDEVAATVEEAGLDVIQLHGDEQPGKYRHVPAKVWKALHLEREPRFDFGESEVDAFLVDSRTDELPGGTGRTCDWGCAAAFVRDQARPVLLAGGLTPWNVEEAILRVQPWGVDVSTGVESMPGKKDMELVGEFIERCRRI